MKGDSSDGSSLIEMLAALLVAAIAMFVLAGGFGIRQQPPNAGDLAKRIAFHAAALSAEAVATGTTRQLMVDVKSRAIIIGTINLNVPENHVLTVVTGAELIEQDVKGSILFFADGTSSGGEISITDSSAGTATIRINWITGAIQLGWKQT